MVYQIVAFLLKSNSVKTAGAAAGGSIASVVFLMGLLEKDIDRKIDSVNQDIIRYVDTRHDRVSTDINYIKESQREIKTLLEKINDRVYELNKNGG